jgi:protein-tyrosine phosphatase
VLRADVLADAPQDAAAALAPLAASLMSEGPVPPGAPGVAAISADLRGLMLDSYRDFARLPSARAAAAASLRAVLHADGPVLLHCTAGKDRTGWIAALLLTIAGVPWSEVTTDYLASAAPVAELFAPLRTSLAGRGIDPALLDPLLGVDARWLDVARETAQQMHGTLEAYPTQGLGLSTEEVEALRVVLRAQRRA